VRAEIVPGGFRALGVEYESGLTGRHAVMNLLAAIAVGGEFGIAPGRVGEAIRRFTGGGMGGGRLGHGGGGGGDEWLSVEAGVVVWNDCYNSNPEAAQSMIDVLSSTAAGKRIAVLGEMLELGAAAEGLHRQVGRYAADHGVDLLVGIQGSARAMVEAAREAGVEAHYFDDAGEAGRFARQAAQAGDAVLFKGSRGVRVERALERF